MNKKEAYKIVFDDLTRNPLFMGKYDAKNGNEDFMYSIATVMEIIAINSDDTELYEWFNDKFYQNIIDSKNKHLTK